MMGFIKKIIFTGLCIFWAISGIAQRASHVVLVTIDGFRPDFYLDPSWGAVNLREMMQEGMYAEGVNSIFPTVTFPNHTTILTGVKSAGHGIYYNKPFCREGKSSEWYWYYKAITAPTLWDAVDKSNGIVASVNWPVSVGAPVEYNIPIIKEEGSSRLQAIAKYCTPQGLLEEVQENATGKLEAIDFAMEKDYLVLDANLARIGAYLIRRYKPALTTIRLSCVDHFAHIQGRDGVMVRRAVAGADRAIRTIVEAVDRAGIRESTAIIITGDHGFVDRHTVLAPNVWLTRAGLAPGDKNDWKARFHSAGGSAFLMLNDRQDSEALQKVKNIIKNLPENYRKLFKVVGRPRLDSMQVDPHAALALAAIPGVAFSGSSSGEPVRPGSGGTHGYFPDFPAIQTGFIGYGAGFQQGTVIPVMGLEDVAPIVAALLGLEFSTASGIVYPGLLTKENIENKRP